MDESLSFFQTSYLDLYLIHWCVPDTALHGYNVNKRYYRPVAFKKEFYEKGQIVIDEALTADPYPTWKKLEELVDKGKIRNIGISK